MTNQFDKRTSLHSPGDEILKRQKTYPAKR